MKRPVSFTVFNIVVWITKLLPVIAAYYFIEYVNAHLDFYKGLGLRDIRDYLYVYMVICVFTGLSTIFLFGQKKWALSVYYLFKSGELHCLIMALPTLVYGWQRALHIENGFTFQFSAWCFVVSMTLICPLIYHTYRKLYK